MVMNKMAPLYNILMYVFTPNRVRVHAYVKESILFRAVN